MARANPAQHQNTGSQGFYRVYVGFEPDSAESMIFGHSGAELYQVRPTSVKMDAVEGEIYKISTGDRSHPTYLFHGPLKTSDAKVTLELPTSKNNDAFRRKFFNEWDSRTDMRAWTIMVFIYDEQNKQPVKGWRWMAGLASQLASAGEVKGASGDAAVEEFTFAFERMEDLHFHLRNGKGTFDDITDQPLKLIDTPFDKEYATYTSFEPLGVNESSSGA